MKNILVFFCLLLSTQLFSQNYDESKIPPYTLPNPLVTNGKKPVTTVATWENIRRQEILALFENNVYGQMPKRFDSIQFKSANTPGMVMGGKAFMRRAEISVWRMGKQVKINLLMFIPSSAKKPSPVFLFINNRGIDQTDPTRKVQSEFWPAEMVIDSGYAIAAFHVSDVAPDNNDHYKEGVLQLYPEQLTMENGMKAIGAWAWAASRVMDYFEREKVIDPKHVFLVGHSRGGKTALWAGAQDQRFAMIFSNCSGNTGAALSRRQIGETVKKINTTFPYWFCDNYKKYNDNVAALPVDQHMLISLIAPRPLYTTNATKDVWADPKGSYMSVKSAEPVYSLYKKKSALPKSPPKVEVAIIASPLGYHIREGEHDLTKFDWNNFIRFANYHTRK